MGILHFVKRLAFPGKLIKVRRIEAPSGMTPSTWSSLRAPLTEHDRVLVSETHHWLRSIPRAFHPRQLCIHYPRAANRIARSWHDPELVDGLLNDLLSDQRGDRTGFPARIVDELKLLRQFHEHPHDAWRQVMVTVRRPQHTPDSGPDAPGP